MMIMRSKKGEPKNNQKIYRGFTLIEMLLVTSLMAMTSLAVYHALANGLKVWQISNRYAQEEDIAIFLDKISLDLRNAVNYSLIKFEGKKASLSFATVVRTLADPAQSYQTEYFPQIGRVEYQFDQSKGTIFRWQTNYGQALAQKFGPSRPLVHSIRDVKFSYYIPESDQISFKDETKDWPMGVFIEVSFSNKKGEEQNTLSKLVNIPSGNKL